MSSTFLSYIVILLVGYSFGATILGGKNSSHNVIVAPTETVDRSARNIRSFFVFLILVGILAMIIYIVSSN